MAKGDPMQVKHLIFDGIMGEISILNSLMNYHKILFIINDVTSILGLARHFPWIMISIEENSRCFS